MELTRNGQLVGEIEKIEPGIAENIIHKIIWGDSDIAPEPYGNTKQDTAATQSPKE